MKTENLIDFEKQYSDYEEWYANRPPSEIRKKIGYKIIYLDYICRYRGYYSIKSGIIKDAHRSFIIFENGDNVDKRDIIKSGISKEIHVEPIQ